MNRPHGPYSVRAVLAMGGADVEVLYDGRVVVNFRVQYLADDGTRCQTVRWFPDLATAIRTVRGWPAAWRGEPRVKVGRGERWRRTG